MRLPQSFNLTASKRSNSVRLPQGLNVRQKQSNSARFPQVLNVATSKTREFCETSSIFEVDNKNEAILRDFLQTWKVECRADSLVTMRFAIFPVYVSKALRLPRNIHVRSRSYEVLHLSRKIILANLQVQNATPLKKSAPKPPNISDEHVSCTAPATQNASPTPAIVDGNATKPYKTLTFSSRLAKCRLPWCLPRKTKLTFWLWNVLRATTACTFSTSQLPKVVWMWCVIVHVDFEMCFAP